MDLQFFTWATLKISFQWIHHPLDGLQPRIELRFPYVNLLLVALASESISAQLNKLKVKASGKVVRWSWTSTISNKTSCVRCWQSSGGGGGVCMSKLIKGTITLLHSLHPPPSPCHNNLSAGLETFRRTDKQSETHCHRDWMAFGFIYRRSNLCQEYTIVILHLVNEHSIDRQQLQFSFETNRQNSWELLPVFREAITSNELCGTEASFTLAGIIIGAVQVHHHQMGDPQLAH